MTYLEKLRKRIDESGSNLCVGLDPRPDYIDTEEDLHIPEISVI